LRRSHAGGEILSRGGFEERRASCVLLSRAAIVPRRRSVSIQQPVGVTSHIATVLVLAAGQGKRMNSDLPKVVHTVCGRPMLLHVLDAARAVQPERIVVVLGHGYEKVLPFLPSDCVVALQEHQLGTGHAVLAAAADVLAGDMLVLPGDTPLVTGEALSALVRDHSDSGAVATVLTMDLADPTGYGRVVRGADGSLLRIVEHRDATDEERGIAEVNSGMYVLPAGESFEVLRGAGSDNDQQEIYLTDVIAGLRQRGRAVAASKIADPSLVLGVNTPGELAQVEAIMTRRAAAAAAGENRH
jgi:bifunctional UDP-N-acetylglucosamine pyrophosphorylase / glucosamine-1-phosphate N-acetyltransferase